MDQEQLPGKQTENQFSFPNAIASISERHSIIAARLGSDKPIRTPSGIGSCLSAPGRFDVPHDAAYERTRPNDSAAPAKLHLPRRVKSGVAMPSHHHDPHRIALKAYGKGDFAAAERIYAKLLRQVPGDFNALHMLGVIRARQGKFSEAEGLIARALRYGQSAEALSNHGNVLSELGRHEEAIRQFRHALLIKPNSPEAEFNLGNALVKIERMDEAAKAFAAAIAAKPDLPGALQNHADVLRELGRHREAAVVLHRAISLSPQDPELRIRLGGILQESGDLEGARAAFEAALSCDPSATSAYYNWVRLAKVAENDDIVPRMEAQALAANTLAPKSRAMLAFALAKAYEDTGRYDDAFVSLLEANRLVRGSIDFDEAKSQQQCRRLREAFTAALLDGRQGYGCKSDLPIFIVGFPRSGTTLTEQILASHPQIAGGGETSFLADLASAEILQIGGSQGGSATIGFPESLSLLPPERFREIGELYVERLRRIAPEAHHITDKLPGNYLFIGLIRLILPNAKIIHVERDALDTCISCFAQRFRRDNVGYAYELGELGRQYRLYRDLMAHWRRILPPGGMLEVRYENLVENLEAEARRIVEFCRLPWDARCLDFHQTDRTVRTASVTQVRRPIYRTSLQRWRRYEKHLAPLIAALGDGLPEPGVNPLPPGPAQPAQQR